MDYKIDAKNKRLGRVATEIAMILQGKKSAKYERNKVGSDRAVVSNWDQITISGDKVKQKIYYHHTGYVGHLKELTFQQLWDRDPKKVLREAVRRMLPKNFLNQKRIKNLVFTENETK